MLNESATDEQITKVLEFPAGVGLLNEAGEPYKFFRAAHLDYAEYVQRIQQHYTPRYLSAAQ